VVDFPYCISFEVFKKSEEPPSSGWRWCRWGEYIGTQEPKADYLYDEPFIE